MQFADLDLNKMYTYADYYQWKFAERVELIKGKIFKMSPAPRRIHQEVAAELLTQFVVFLRNKPCKVFIAPFDVRLPRKSKDDKDIITVLQPDICVVCDPSKLDKRGCIGAPDLVIEVLSPGNSAKEMKFKYEAYEEAGVKEYWIVDTSHQFITVYTLVNEKFVAAPAVVQGETLTTPILPGFTLDISQVFKGIDAEEE